jgi:hypothetical protein
MLLVLRSRTVVAVRMAIALTLASRTVLFPAKLAALGVAWTSLLLETDLCNFVAAKLNLFSRSLSDGKTTFKDCKRKTRVEVAFQNASFGLLLFPGDDSSGARLLVT